MSNLEASRILASALKDVDEILKVNNYETDEGYDAEINNDRRNILPEISFQDAEGKHCIENLNDCRNLPDETYLYRAGKDFSVLINRLQICINKLNQSTPAASICTSEYQALDFRVTENSSFDIAHPTTTQRTKFNLNLIEQPQQMISQYMFPPNEFSTYLNDKRFHQRITKLRGQVQAQANRIAELEKDGNPLSYMVNKNCTTTGHRNKNISQLISTDMDNLQLLNEVSKQHLRINALEETNRDLEKKINKLELNYPSIFRRSITPVTFDNRCSFITTPNQPEYNLNFINQSLTGTQSTPPTSRLINDKPYRYDAYIPCEEINKLSFLGENYAHLNSDQFKSASLNELCYSRVMQPVTTTTNINTTTSSNNIVSPNTSKRWLAQNRYSMKSPPADIFNSSIQESGRINLLPPQYGSSYHQHIYNNSRTRSPIPLQWYPYTRNNFIDGGQTSADCQLNGSVNLFNSSGECDSPSSGRCTTVQDTHLYTSRNKSNLSNAFSSSPSDQQHHMKTVNNSTNILKDEKSLSLSKSTLNGKNQLKRLNIERAYGKGWRSITIPSSPSLIDVFHWLSQGQMNNFTSNGLNKSDSMHHQCKPQNNLNNSALSIRSKSIERYYGSGSMKGSTIRSRRKTQETNLPFVSNSDNHHVDDVPANPVYDSSLPSVLHTNSICNNKSQRSYQGSPLESNENGPLNRNMSVLSKNESCNNNHVKNGPHSSDSYKNTQSDSSSVRHGSDEFTSSYLDNVNFITWDKNMISAWLYKIGLGYTVTHTRRWLTSGQDLVNESKKSLAQDDLSVLKMSNELHVLSLRWGLQMLRHINFDRNRLCRSQMEQYRFTPDLLADILRIPQFTKKKNIFNSNRGHKSNHYNHVSSVGDDDASTELVCPIEIDASHMSIFAEEVVKPNRQSMHLRAENVPTILIDPVATNVQHLELQETDL
ncbi:hypothetical protein Smp_138100 [Schistosoma mansoni]|uniref:hypothetical protein n=1 Tax=Schistosoma mansoni TaxID=6183 RepID=UPI00022C8136|nr:hypothetical protein Smp_138100 [Schistosoma mansoni]|eukprot:XP_018645550.1 hypothetical protein Smp_138100 [Schistosoma mansoni]